MDVASASLASSVNVVALAPTSNTTAKHVPRTIDSKMETDDELKVDDTIL